MNLRKDFNKIDIINECTELFFPNGMNQHGHLKVMEVNLSDFALMPLSDEHTTIGDMVDKVKLNKLKFYLKTRLGSPSSTRECNTNDTESSDGDMSPMLRQRVHSTLGSPPSAQHASSTLSLPPLAQHARSTLSTPPSAQCASSKEYITLMPPHYASSTESLFTGAPSTDNDDVYLLDNDRHINGRQCHHSYRNINSSMAGQLARN